MPIVRPTRQYYGEPNGPEQTSIVAATATPGVSFGATFVPFDGRLQDRIYRRQTQPGATGTQANKLGQKRNTLPLTTSSILQNGSTISSDGQFTQIPGGSGQGQNALLPSMDAFAGLGAIPYLFTMQVVAVGTTNHVYASAHDAATVLFFRAVQTASGFRLEFDGTPGGGTALNTVALAAAPGAVITFGFYVPDSGDVTAFVQVGATYQATAVPITNLYMSDPQGQSFFIGRNLNGSPQATQVCRGAYGANLPFTLTAGALEAACRFHMQAWGTLTRHRKALWPPLSLAYWE